MHGAHVEVPRIKWKATICLVGKSTRPLYSSLGGLRLGFMWKFLSYSQMVFGLRTSRAGTDAALGFAGPVRGRERQVLSLYLTSQPYVMPASSAQLDFLWGKP